jgi:hypothetical protein
MATCPRSILPRLSTVRLVISTDCCFRPWERKLELWETHTERKRIRYRSNLQKAAFILVVLGNQLLISGDDGMLFEAPNVSGSVGPASFAYLAPSGMSSTSVAGMLSFFAHRNAARRCEGAGDPVVADPPGSPVPEPVSMALVGTGLLAIGIALRLTRFGLKG